MPYMGIGISLGGKESILWFWRYPDVRVDSCI